MHNQGQITFQEALDIIESLPEQQQENIINIIGKRLIEHRRDILAENIKKAREEFARGDVKKGTIDDLMRDLSEWGFWYGVTPLQELLNV